MTIYLPTYFISTVYFITLYPEFSSLLTCNLRKNFTLNEIHKPGDVVLGGLFEVHYTSVLPERAFTSEPQQPLCKG